MPLYLCSRQTSSDSFLPPLLPHIPFLKCVSHYNVSRNATLRGWRAHGGVYANIIPKNKPGTIIIAAKHAIMHIIMLIFPVLCISRIKIAIATTNKGASIQLAQKQNIKYIFIIFSALQCKGFAEVIGDVLDGYRAFVVRAEEHRQCAPVAVVARGQRGSAVALVLIRERKG